METPMVEYKELLNREKSRLWFVKVLAGLLIIFFMTLHMIVNHLVAPEGLLSYQDVLDYYQNPIIPIIEILFLITVITHCLLGLRSIILDLNPAAGLMKKLDVGLLLLGLISAIYGILLVIIITSRI
jgi:succinate dehydrogenase hydrophobic anchor subunit